MTTALLGLFADAASASRAVAQLEDAGFGADHLQVVARDPAGTPFDVDAGTFRASDLWAGYGARPDEARFYGDGVEAGGALVVVLADGADADRAAALLAEHGPVPYPG